MSRVWSLFPFPTLTRVEQRDGSVRRFPKVCADCLRRECLSDVRSSPGDLRQCRFGVTYARVDDERLIVGVVATDLPMATRRAQGLAKRSPELRVRSTDIRQAIEAARSLGAGAVDDFELARDEILSQLRADPDMHEALAGRLRRDFDANLDQSHDFLQLVKLVRGHAEALLLKAHPKMDVLEAAEHEPNLGAIYFSTELMLIKMDSLAFLREINLALESSPAFQVHPYVLKYVRIYNWQAKQKNLHLRVTGSSHGRITLNSKAIGFVVQGLLDNLVKYAPAGSDAAAHFSETEDFINIEFVGLGPRIAPNELEQIFLPGFRAAAAREIEASGLGVGLATAKQISNILDLQLTVRQSPKADAKYAARYETAFGVRLPRTN